MNKPLISIIIPTYNGAAYLKEAIESVLNQSYPHFEIWVIDNGSIDNTAQIAQSFPQVRYVELKGEANTARARNEGIARARGAFLAFLDQDDIWTSDKLAKQLDYLEKHPTVSGVVCHQQMVLQPGHEKPHWLKKEFLETAQPAYLPSALLVKQTLFKQTAFDPRFSLTSDVAWFFHAKHSEIEIALLPGVLLIRRIHSDNASHRCSQVQKEILSAIHLSLKERRTKISIIIPVYNGEKYVKEAIESALAQDYPNKEVLVINDGSTDSTQSIIDHFGSRIRSIYQSNRGLGAARNTAIRASTGAYLAFLDHDDLWEKDKLSLQMAEMDETDPLVFSYVKQFVCPTLNAQERSQLQVDEKPLPSNFAGNLLVSKKRFLQIGFFFEKKTVGEFVDWYLRALEAKVPIIMLPKLTLHRRIHTHNMGRQKELYERTEYLKILKSSLERRRSRATSS